MVAKVKNVCVTVSSFSVSINFELAPTLVPTFSVLHNFRFLCLSASFCWQLPSSGSAIHGQVQSPLFPRPYLPNLLRQWDVWVPEGYVIQLSLTHLDIKASSGCYQDSLTVRVIIKT